MFATVESICRFVLVFVVSGLGACSFLVLVFSGLGDCCVLVTVGFFSGLGAAGAAGAASATAAKSSSSDRRAAAVVAAAALAAGTAARCFGAAALLRTRDGAGRGAVAAVLEALDAAAVLEGARRRFCTV